VLDTIQPVRLRRVADPAGCGRAAPCQTYAEISFIGVGGGSRPHRRVPRRGS